MDKVWPCPYNGKTCVNGKRRDFDKNKATGEQLTCPEWNYIRIVDPRTGLPVDEWNCGKVLDRIIQIKLIQSVEQTAASLNQTADQVNKSRMAMLGMVSTEALERLRAAAPKLLTKPIEGDERGDGRTT